MKEETPTQPIKLFQNIALTFSGGGYRASSFSLGILSYLNEVQFDSKPLLENVKGLSTVSGGTLTGATYAYYMEEGRTFPEFYDHFYNTLDRDELLETALNKIADDDIWKNSHKKRSLINAFALAYADLLTKGSFDDINQEKSHLEDICFNASEFSYGLAFRFQTSGHFGNYRLKNSNLDDLFKQIKLADAIASSSCFPLGFEPIIMPDDFIEDKSSPDYITLKANEEFKKGVGLMDGGIIDNQGVGSIMNANRRRIKNGNPFDLFMICDVGSYFMDPWEPAKLEEDKSIYSMSPKKIYKLIKEYLKYDWVLYTPMLLGILVLLAGFIFLPFNLTFIIAGGVIMLGIIAIGIKKGVDRIEKEILIGWNWLMGKVPDFLKGKLKYFEKIKLRIFKRMFEERMTSAVKMVSEIFLKQIRRLNYDLLYKDNDLQNKRITALIYELTEEQFDHGASDEIIKDMKVPRINGPSDAIYDAARIASDMKTTLWFTEDDKEKERLKNLVSCGQFTACYNLLKYCADLEKAKADVDMKLLRKMKSIFKSDWEKFRDDPYWLHNSVVMPIIKQK